MARVNELRLESTAETRGLIYLLRLLQHRLAGSAAIRTSILAFGKAG